MREWAFVVSSSLRLTDEERSNMLNALNGNIYKLAPKHRYYLILRLYTFLSDGGTSYDPSVLTTDHVLPQTVN